MKSKETIQQKIKHLKNRIGVIERDLQEEQDHRNYLDLESELNGCYIECNSLEWVLKEE